MRATDHRLVVQLAVAAAIFSFVLSACSGTTTPTANATPVKSTSAPASTPPASTPPPSPVSGPMTGEELVWLESIGALHRKIDRALTELPCCASKKDLHALEVRLRGCTRELAKKGSPSKRLQPVFALVKKACAQYDKGAACLAAAAAIGIPFGGSPEERKLNAAIKCGFSAPGKGTVLLADAESTGDGVKLQAT
jgi:hypothetical protein